MVDQDTLARSGSDWHRAPRDGSVIYVEFEGGEIGRARWDRKQKDWQLATTDGKPIMMHDVRHDEPRDWWPDF